MAGSGSATRSAGGASGPGDVVEAQQAGGVGAQQGRAPAGRRGHVHGVQRQPEHVREQLPPARGQGAPAGQPEPRRRDDLPSSASSASRIANAVPSSAHRSSDVRSSASDSAVQEPRSAGSEYGVRSPDRCGTKIGS